MGHSLVRSAFVALAVGLSVIGSPAKAESVTFNLTAGQPEPTTNPYSVTFSSINVVDVDGYSGNDSVSGLIAFNTSTDRVTFTVNGYGTYTGTLTDIQTPVFNNSQIIATGDIAFTSSAGAGFTQLSANIELEKVNNTVEIQSGTVTVSAVPEPSSFVLGGLAVLGVGGTMLRRKRTSVA